MPESAQAVAEAVAQAGTPEVTALSPVKSDEGKTGEEREVIRVSRI